MKVILIDDEAMALENLTYVIKQFDGIEIAGAFTDPFAALQSLSKLKPDAVFLDIEMPQVNGFTVAEEIMELLPEINIVFVTGFDEYAVRAFEINAIDYVLKPVFRKRIEQTINKLLKNCGNSLKGGQTADVSNLIASMSRKHINKVIAWKKDKIIPLNPAQILCFIARSGEVDAVTAQGQFKVRNALNYWDEQLSGLNFFRCHRSYLVSIDKIEMIRPMFNNTFDIKLINYPNYIPVSRKYARQLKQMLEFGDKYNNT